jgi:hypothetical protein
MGRSASTVSDGVDVLMTQLCGHTEWHVKEAWLLIDLIN